MFGFPKLHCLFYSEFHPIQGPKVIYEVPEGSLTSKDTKLFDFDQFSDLVIPKTPLCHRLITFCTRNYKVVGCPITIESDKYERNALMFNLCFVFDINSNTFYYEALVKKMNIFLKTIEEDREFLSNPERKQYLLPTFEHMLEDLNNMCETRIMLGKTDILNLKLFPLYKQPIPILQHQTPLPLVDLSTLREAGWDLTTLQTISHINGINHIKKISQLSGVEMNLTQKCVDNLAYYGGIQTVDTFQYSNIYAVKHSVNQLITNPNLQSECIHFVIPPGKPGPSFPKLFSLYCSLQSGITVGQWVEDNQLASLNVDVRRFFLFGIMRNVLYRVHQYPILIEEVKGCIPLGLKKHLDGLKSMDEICCEYGYTYKEMNDLLLLEPGVKFVYR